MKIKLLMCFAVLVMVISIASAILKPHLLPPDYNEQFVRAVYYEDNLDAARDALQHGANPNALIKEDQTALMFSLWTGKNKLTALLLEKGADVNVPARDGNTALLCALSADSSAVSLDFIRQLLDKGADVNAQAGGGVDGQTPLIKAIAMRRTQAVPLLLSRHADPNRQDGTGVTALMLAVSRADVALVKALLKAGADPDLQEISGWRALSLAKARKQKPLLRLLKRAGAQPCSLPAKGIPFYLGGPEKHPDYRMPHSPNRS